MHKIYLVQEVGFQYDDNYYFRIDGGTPVKSYSSFELANAKALEEEIKSVRQIIMDENLYEYCNEYTLDETRIKINKYFSNEDEINFEPEYFIESLCNFRNIDSDNLSEGDVRMTIDLFNLSFYEVVEVEFEHELS